MSRRPRPAEMRTCERAGEGAVGTRPGRRSTRGIGGPRSRARSLAIVLAQHVLERLAKEDGFLRLLALGETLEAAELRRAVVRRLQDHIVGGRQTDGVAALLLGRVEREIGLAHELFRTLG